MNAMRPVTSMRSVTSTHLVTFTSDFGWAGGYVAACEAIVTRVDRQTRVLHITHDVPLGDIAAGALALKRVAPLYPCAVHLAVVDPGVGTGRLCLALSTERGDVLVGPDNGLLLDAGEALGGIHEAWSLDPLLVRRRAGLPPGISSTFQGRDVFAPAAGLLAGNNSPAALGSPLDPAALVRLQPPVVETTPDGAVAEVIEIDRFGNVGLALTFADLVPKEGRFRVEIMDEDTPEWYARIVQTYADLEPGELGVFCDSWGQVGLTLRSASAAQLLALDRGTKVRLTAVRDRP